MEYGNLSATPAPEDQPTAPLPQPPTPVHEAAQTTSAAAPTAGLAGGDVCPNCGSQMSADQRYCLACGERRGEPRLPVMQASALQSAAAPTAPPPKQKRKLSPNTTLIATIATLLLAMGVGVLIGHSGKSSDSSGDQGVQVVKVGGAGGAAASGAKTKKTEGKVPSGKNAKTGKSKKAVSQTYQKNLSGGTATALKAAPGVKLPPATVKPGSSCDSSAAGCENGKFTGGFFSSQGNK
jgi:hypothetical protein